jgi:hypothetical protein
MMEFGKGETFRRAGWLERAGAAFRRPLANSSLKAPLKRLYEAVLDRAPGDRLVCRFPGGEAVRLAAAFRQVVWNAATRCCSASGWGRAAKCTDSSRLQAPGAGSPGT